MLNCARPWSSPWPEWRDLGGGGAWFLESGLKAGERPEECRSALLTTGEITGWSGEATEAGEAREVAYWESPGEATEPSL
ncbi:b33d3d34-5242-41d2-9545-0db84488f505 [Thermothielavioides terrestris]|jgi:hypothetical protein|uniref:B33d3d34-5242-41d2-9545-0db84488f505 n=1 Tax=Thermothielavioides terrestris TaxID=2587410 RepID=A0A3S4BEZ2_9PEZI|nr:b33d3d34-5242-41d2-9545-0db84488f505 [Thermothielavioides terrestris]